MLKTDQPFASSVHFYAYFQSYRAHVEKRITGNKVEHIIHSIAEKIKVIKTETDFFGNTIEHGPQSVSREEYVENNYSNVLPNIFINLIEGKS